jgi:hypothetical protein
MTTRKHFIAAANAVSKINCLTDRRKTAEHHAQIFAQDNPRFDKARFMLACGVR